MYSIIKNENWGGLSEDSEYKNTEKNKLKVLTLQSSGNV